MEIQWMHWNDQIHFQSFLSATCCTAVFVGVIQLHTQKGYSLINPTNAQMPNWRLGLKNSDVLSMKVDFLIAKFNSFCPHVCYTLPLATPGQIDSLKRAWKSYSGGKSNWLTCRDSFPSKHLPERSWQPVHVSRPLKAPLLTSQPLPDCFSPVSQSEA